MVRRAAIRAGYESMMDKQLPDNKAWLHVVLE
jgi:hypothetical protein